MVPRDGPPGARSQREIGELPGASYRQPHGGSLAGHEQRPPRKRGLRSSFPHGTSRGERNRIARHRAAGSDDFLSERRQFAALARRRAWERDGCPAGAWRGTRTADVAINGGEYFAGRAGLGWRRRDWYLAG